MPESRSELSFPLSLVFLLLLLISSWYPANGIFFGPRPFEIVRALLAFPALRRCIKSRRCLERLLCFCWRRYDKKQLTNLAGSVTWSEISGRVVMLVVIELFQNCSLLTRLVSAASGITTHLNSTLRGTMLWQLQSRARNQVSTHTHTHILYKLLEKTSKEPSTNSA